MSDEKQRINLTDKEAKFIKGNGKIDVNYSCQTAISEDGIIISAYTSNCSSDRTDTIKTVSNAELNAEENYTEILADSGYASFDNFEELDKRNKIVTCVPSFMSRKGSGSCVCHFEKKCNRGPWIHPTQKPGMSSTKNKKQKMI